MWRLLLSLLLLVVALPLVPGVMTASAAMPGTSNWAGFRAAINQQSLQTVLLSIEERLRGLDNLYSARYAPRLDLSMEQQARRLDTIESRLGRLETLLELRLDKVSETLSARQLKEELSKDQLGRKVDSNYERLNHRLGYMEARLDMGITKLQTSVEAGSSRIERLELALGGRHGEAGAEMLDVKNGLDELKRSFQGYHNTTMTAVASSENTMKLYYNRLTESLVQIHGELNRTLVQNDAEDPSRRDETGKMLNAVERHASNFGSKVTNMYNELWRRTQMLETVSKDSMSLSNATRRELQEGLRSMAMQMSRYCCLQADRGKSSSLDMTLESLGGSVADVSRKLDTYFQTLITTHEVILQNCHRIQKEEPLIEERLTDVLERILDITSNNRCQSMGQELQEVHELLKSHHTTVVRNVGHSTNTVMRAADNSSKENKNLVDVIAEVRDGLIASNRDIHNSLASMQEGQGNVNHVLEKITSTLQEFNEQLAEINSASLFGEHSEDTTSNVTVVSCPDSKTIAADVAEKVSKLPILAIAPIPSETMRNNLTREQVKAFTELLITELKDKGVQILAEINEEVVNPNSAVLTNKTKSAVHDVEKHTKKQHETETEANRYSEHDQDKEDEDISDDDEDEILPETNLEIHTDIKTIIQTSQLKIPENEQNNNSNMSNTSNNTSNPINSTIAGELPAQNKVDNERQTDLVLDSDKESKAAELTIKIIPHPQLRSESFNFDNSSAMLEIDLNHVAAIIHSTDSDIKGQGPQASVTIVHNDKAVTAEGQVKYSSTMIGPPAELIKNPVTPIHNEKDSHHKAVLPRSFESSLPPGYEYLNNENINTSVNEVEGSSSTNTQTIQSTDKNVTYPNISVNPLFPAYKYSGNQESNTSTKKLAGPSSNNSDVNRILDVDTPFLTVPVTTTPTPVICKNCTTIEKPFPLNFDNYTSLDSQSTTENTEETRNDSLHKSDLKVLASVSKPDPNSIRSEKEYPEVQVGEFFKKLMEMHGRDVNTNKTIQNIWATIQLYSKQDLGPLYHKAHNNSEIAREHLATNFDNPIVNSVMKSPQDRFTEASAGETVTVNRTDIDVPIRHYVSKLEELATRLARVNSTSQDTTDSSSNITDFKPQFEYPLDQENNNVTDTT